MDCYCDYEPPAFFDQEDYVARKEHRCCECGRLIRPGERYNRTVGKWDGLFKTFRRCSHCDLVVDSLKTRLPCYCDSFGGLWETIGDGYMDDLLKARTGDYFAVMRLIVAAKQARHGSLV